MNQVAATMARQRRPVDELKRLNQGPSLFRFPGHDRDTSASLEDRVLDLVQPFEAVPLSRRREHVTEVDTLVANSILEKASLLDDHQRKAFHQPVEYGQPLFEIETR